MFPVPWSVLSRLSLDEVRLAGSHNSTLGKEDGGDRRSLKEQLEMGLRVVELDMFGHPDGFQLGHKAIGHQTATRVPGNPATLSFVDWLNVVRDFVNSPSPSSSSSSGSSGSGVVEGRARRLPLILYLDLKNDHLARVKSAQEHNLASLNQAVETAFAGRLVTVDQFERLGRRPTLADLEGKVMVVLTGHEKTRYLYRHDSGYWPTVSVSSRHQVLQVHCARAVGNGALWYWVGRVCDAVRDPIFPHSPDSAVASVDWFQHGWLKVKGHHPTAAYNAQGWIVVVYEYDNPIGFGHSLRYVTAQVSLATSYPIVLQRQNITLPQDGHQPFVDLNDDNAVVLAFYESAATLCLKYGSLDPKSASISWSLSRSLPVIPRPSVHSLSFRFRDRSSHSADLHIIQSPSSSGSSSGSSGSSFSAGFGDLPRSLESEVVATPRVVHGVDKCPIPGRAVSVLVSSSTSLVFYSLASTAQLGEGTEPIWMPINFKQVCFIDHHPYDTLVKSSEAYFHAHNATRDPGVWAKRKEGDLKFVRAWRLNHDLWRKALAPHINFVATDNPFDPAFVDFCKSNNVFLDNPSFVNFDEPPVPVGLPPSSIAPSPLNSAIVDISAYSSSTTSSVSAEAVAAGVDSLAVSYGSNESASPYSSCPPGYWD